MGFQTPSSAKRRSKHQTKMDLHTHKSKHMDAMFINLELLHSKGRIYKGGKTGILVTHLSVLPALPR